MRRDGARIDQGVCITSHASQCRTVDQVVVLPDGADAKGWYVSLSRARDSMHVCTRDKAALRQSVMYPGERKSVWELVQALRRSEAQSRNRMMPDLWATRQAERHRFRNGATKAVIGNCTRLTHSLFVSDIPRRFLQRVSLVFRLSNNYTYSYAA